MKRVLITGGSGFIGRYICRACEKEGIEYLSLCNSRLQGMAHEKQVDLLDTDALRRTLTDFRPDTVIHLAAIASAVHKDVAEIYRVNVCGTENLLLAIAETVPGARLVMASTAGVYGNQNVPLLHEGLPFNPVNHYSCSKMVTEILSRQYSDRLSIAIVRPFNIIGMGQNEDFFIPKLVRRFARREPVIELGNLDAVRDYVSVDYCTRVIMRFARGQETEERIVNICTGIGHSCNDVIRLLEQLTGHYPEIRSTSTFRRSNEIWSLVGDPARLKRLMGGGASSETLEDVLKTMLACMEGT